MTLPYIFVLTNSRLCLINRSSHKNGKYLNIGLVEAEYRIPLWIDEFHTYALVPCK